MRPLILHPNTPTTRFTARGFCLAALISLVPAVLTSCGGDDAPGATQGGSGGAGGGHGGAGGTGGDDGRAVVGEACSTANPCRNGLACAVGLCAPGGASQPGDSCVISAECDAGQCVGGTCQLASQAEPGAACASDVDCDLALRCQIVGFYNVCEPEGGGDLGARCSSNSECFAGLDCTNGACARPSADAPFGGTAFEGVACADDASGAHRAYFEVPGAAEADEGDFFRLPFPNDARITSEAKLDLTGFPTPGPGALDADPVQPFVDAVTESDTGWGSDPAVLFRFSSALDPDSLDREQLHFVDLGTDVDPSEREALGDWYYSEKRTPYVCGNWLGLLRERGRPMRPGHLYAAYVNDGVRDSAGNALAASANFKAVLADDEPDDAALREVHARYAPFRAYLEANDLDPARIIDASVMTAAPLRDPMAQLASLVEAAAPPKTHDWVKCESGVTSPCPQHDSAQGRDCSEPDANFDEYQALVDLPIFQRGAAPYLGVTDGGDVRLDRPARTEAVCLSLTVPKAEMPRAGWPLVVFAHGTGGSFRDHVAPQIADRLATAELPSGELMPIAVLGIDQVEHGPRRGDSTLPPENLLYNLANPNSARGNALQGAVDQLSLARLASDFDVSVGDDVLRIDGNKVLFFGHSQGAAEGSLMLPYSKIYKAAVLSASGGGRREALLGRRSPIDTRAALPLLFGDPSLTKDPAARFHPVLSLLGQWSDPADPINFASGLVSAPLDDAPARHVFQTYGLGDSFDSPTTAQAFAIAAGMTVVENPGFAADAIPELESAPAPVAGNADGVTLALREYKPDVGVDGHFVAFANAQANDDVIRFLAMAAHGDTPAVGE
jgi:hypothetical protein